MADGWVSGCFTLFNSQQMKNIIKIILWVTFIIYAIIVLKNQIQENSVIVIIFWIPAVIIGGAIIYAITRAINSDD